MIPRLWDELVVRNPMLIEIQRFRRRYLSFSGAHAVNSAVLALVAVCYCGIVLLVCNFRGDLSPVVLVIIQTVLFTLFAPGMLYGAIAGERERRSWDLLLVAPITKAQIVAGKFIGALTALGVAAGLLLVPILIAAFTYGSTSGNAIGFGWLERTTNWPDLLTAECVSLSFTICVCALTILFSARVRRPFMALGNSLGTLLLLLVVFPALLASAGGVSGPEGEVIFLLHPFWVLGNLDRYGEHPTAAHSEMTAWLWGWPQVGFYLLVAGVLVAWAANTLVFAENDVKFIPRSPVDA